MTADTHIAAEDETGLALRCSCGGWSMLFRNHLGATDVYREHGQHVRYATVKAERDSLAARLAEAEANLAEAIVVIDRVHAAEKAFLSRSIAAERRLADAERVVEAAKAAVEADIVPLASEYPTEADARDRLVLAALAKAVDAYQSTRAGGPITRIRQELAAAADHAVQVLGDQVLVDQPKEGA